MIDKRYDASDWFWQVGADTTRYWSSRGQAFLDADHPAVVAFTADGGFPSRVNTEAELWAILARDAPDRLPADKAQYREVAAWRFHAVLRIEGLADDLEAVLAALPEPAHSVARARLEHSQTYNRLDPLVDQLGAAMGLSPAQIDALWQAGHAL